jgi:ribose 5-phosphate isomerase B
MKIAIGNDHAAFEMKNEIREYLEGKGYEVLDVGCHSGDRVDYPDYAEKIGNAVVSGEADLGIAICGTGVGMSIAVNKIRGIRAVCCSEPYSAKLSRQHNDSNVLCFGARVIGPELAKMIVDEWLGASFLGAHHSARVEKIKALENK